MSATQNNTISKAYIDTFESNVRHLAQQKGTKLRSKVQERGEGETHRWERLGSAEFAPKTRIQATPESARLWSGRVAVSTPWNDGDITELEDPYMMLVDPNSSLAMSHGFAAGRAMDTIIIRAAVEADALNGDGTTTAFPALQSIGTGTEEISFDMITDVQKVFMDNDIDPEEPKCFVVSPLEVQKLMKLTENTSSDYVRAQQLQQYGIAPSWMGFDWITSTRLNTLATPLVGEHYCFATTRYALGLNLPQDVSVRIAEDPSTSFAYRIYSQFTAGAVRVEDEHIVRLHLTDNYA